MGDCFGAVVTMGKGDLPCMFPTVGDGFSAVVAMGKGDLPCNFSEHGGRLEGWKVEKVEIGFVQLTNCMFLCGFINGCLEMNENFYNQRNTPAH